MMALAIAVDAVSWWYVGWKSERLDHATFTIRWWAHDVGQGFCGFGAQALCHGGPTYLVTVPERQAVPA